MLVEPLAPQHDLQSSRVDRLDLLIGALGYETRLIRVPAALSNCATRTVLVDLESEGECSYDANLESATASGFLIEQMDPAALSHWLLTEIDGIGKSVESRCPHIGLDISSLPRDRLAYLTAAFRSFEERALSEEGAAEAIVDVFYTPAEPPSKEVEPERIEILGPVTPGFAGFAPDFDSPVVAFVGLGIEQDRAIGALEYIEPATTWVFVPFGENESFDLKVRSANSWIWMAVDESQQVGYQVDDPFLLYSTLEQLVESESDSARPILVPLGPKMFAFCCLLVATTNRRAGVWRVSAGVYGRRENCDSAGKLISLRCRLQRAA